jgi:hypothetical protein
MNIISEKRQRESSTRMKRNCRSIAGISDNTGVWSDLRHSSDLFLRHRMYRHQQMFSAEAQKTTNREQETRNITTDNEGSSAGPRTWWNKTINSWADRTLKPNSHSARLHARANADQRASFFYVRFSIDSQKWSHMILYYFWWFNASRWIQIQVSERASIDRQRSQQ